MLQGGSRLRCIVPRLQMPLPTLYVGGLEKHTKPNLIGVIAEETPLKMLSKSTTVFSLMGFLEDKGLISIAWWGPISSGHNSNIIGGFVLCSYIWQGWKEIAKLWSSYSRFKCSMELNLATSAYKGYLLEYFFTECCAQHCRSTTLHVTVLCRLHQETCSSSVNFQCI